MCRYKIRLIRMFMYFVDHLEIPWCNKSTTCPTRVACLTKWIKVSSSVLLFVLSTACLALQSRMACVSACVAETDLGLLLQSGAVYKGTTCRHTVSCCVIESNNNKTKQRKIGLIKLNVKKEYFKFYILQSFP